MFCLKRGQTLRSSQTHLPLAHWRVWPSSSPTRFTNGTSFILYCCCLFVCLSWSIICYLLFLWEPDSKRFFPCGQCSPCYISTQLCHGDIEEATADTESCDKEHKLSVKRWAVSEIPASDCLWFRHVFWKQKGKTVSKGFLSAWHDTLWSAFRKLRWEDLQFKDFFSYTERFGWKKKARARMGKVGKGTGFKHLPLIKLET